MTMLNLYMSYKAMVLKYIPSVLILIICNSIHSIWLT